MSSCGSEAILPSFIAPSSALRKQKHVPSYDLVSCCRLWQERAGVQKDPPRKMNRKLRLVVLGMMGRCPFGGQSWLYLNWLRGLHKLGHGVWYVEDDTVWPYDPGRNSGPDDCLYAVRHIAGCMKRAGMPDTWAFRPAYRTGECHGISGSELNDLYRSCDALLNVVGATDLRKEHLAARFRVYVECDPVIAELQLAKNDAHTVVALANHH